MPGVERSVEINAPIDAVFAAATDPRRGPEWNPNIHDVSGIPTPLQAGSTWQQTAIAMGRPLRLICRVVRLEPPHYGELEVSGEQQGRIQTRCDDMGGRTRLTQRIDFVPPGGMLGRMMGGMIQSALDRELEGTLRRIKMTLEMERGTYGSGTEG